MSRFFLLKSYRCRICVRHDCIHMLLYGWDNLNSHKCGRVHVRQPGYGAFIHSFITLQQTFLTKYETQLWNTYICLFAEGQPPRAGSCHGCAQLPLVFMVVQNSLLFVSMYIHKDLGVGLMGVHSHTPFWQLKPYKVWLDFYDKTVNQPVMMKMANYTRVTVK